MKRVQNRFFSFSFSSLFSVQNSNSLLPCLPCTLPQENQREMDGAEKHTTASSMGGGGQGRELPSSPPSVPLTKRLKPTPASSPTTPLTTFTQHKPLSPFNLQPPSPEVGAVPPPPPPPLAMQQLPYGVFPQGLSWASRVTRRSGEVGFFHVVE